VLHLIAESLLNAIPRQLISQTNETLSLEVIPKGVLVHHVYFQLILAVLDIECERLVPDRRESALLDVSYDLLSFDYQLNVGV
jgi:hypothetical protein